MLMIRCFRVNSLFVTLLDALTEPRPHAGMSKCCRRNLNDTVRSQDVWVVRSKKALRWYVLHGRHEYQLSKGRCELRPGPGSPVTPLQGVRTGHCHTLTGGRHGVLSHLDRGFTWVLSHLDRGSTWGTVTP